MVQILILQIVGGGTAGLTVALRLVESGRFSVAVIEAGGFYEVDAGNFTEIPANENIFTEAPASIDWGIATVNQSVSSLNTTISILTEVVKRALAAVK